MCIYAYSTHLVRSVMQISKYMSQFSGVKLLMGDFNDEPDSNAIRYIHVCVYIHTCMHTTHLLDVTLSNPLPHPLSLSSIPLCVILSSKVWLLSNIQKYVCMHLCVHAECV